ncbi:hypothetical protein PpBr36_00202 [Pyricularia pennisetigena]|uniref:hypothetical protein n=1 Tax=Pyricularia pennisetigena TaxID=1578925 RepID=UPI00114E56B7|nr:hypothetical protein PpBr36_00202 [Pyricularia pennisetigena]TLS29417.1 hypothetical protein PpBr36_00202 [Pyricularia pennisetigena]
MASVLDEEEHQTAYIFTPLEEAAAASSTPRPSKRRKVGSAAMSGTQNQDGASAAPPNGDANHLASLFVPLLGGAEPAECVAARAALFEASWARVDGAVQRVLREANASTLEQVCGFVDQHSAGGGSDDQGIPAAFIVTGPNVSSQDLLFSQLGERLRANGGGAGFVRVGSGEAANLKAVLKKIIRGVCACRPADGEAGDDLELVTPASSRRKYLDYDLEALHVFLKSNHQQQQQQGSSSTPGGGGRNSKRVCVAFEDSEGFDSGLLSDLIALMSSWRDRIRFVLLFGVGTSVELLQARLLRSTHRQLLGAQFDVVRTSTILDQVVRACLEQADGGVVLGPAFLAALLERQVEHVASVQMFVNSIKFAYMCHFYANPLSVLLADEQENLVRPEHVEAVRNLGSFRDEVEDSVDEGGSRLGHARSLLEDDDYLRSQIRENMTKRRAWARKLSRSLQLIADGGLTATEFTSLYVSAVANGLDLAARQIGVIDTIRAMSPEELIAALEKLIGLIGAHTSDEDGADTESSATLFTQSLDTIRRLQARAEDNDTTLRSKYSTQGRILRTTVVAQKVQLSRDTAALTEDDKEYSEVMDRLTDHLVAALSCQAADELFLHEAWLYDSESPHGAVFVPTPGVTTERALARPHDYLACSCCPANGGLGPTMPAASILYHLYQEAGPLINVADLWTAFSALVIGEEDDAEDDERKDKERNALVLFYRGLAELRAMGFVQSTKKKEDHIAKLKWV